MTYKEIADELGGGPEDGAEVPGRWGRRGAAGRPGAGGDAATEDRWVPQVVDRMLADDLSLRASVIHERLVAEYGFAGHYQRVKVYVAGARERIAQAEGVRVLLTGLHRRFEVTAGAQAQVDWGVESAELARALGVRYV